MRTTCKWDGENGEFFVSSRSVLGEQGRSGALSQLTQPPMGQENRLSPVVPARGEKE